MNAAIDFLIPSPEAVAARAAICGSDRKQAAHLAKEQLKASLAELAGPMPETYAQITGLLEQARNAIESASVQITENAARLHETKDLLVRRAHLRAELESTKQRLAAAQTKLGDPGCLNLPDTELVRLQLETEHLPARIAKIEADIKGASAELRKIKGVDLDAARAQIAAQADGRGEAQRHISDPVLHNLIQRGMLND